MIEEPEHGRKEAFEVIRRQLEGRKNLVLMEIGMARSEAEEHKEGDGWSTLYLAYLANLTESVLISIDVSAEVIDTCTMMLEKRGLFTGGIHLIEADALDYLKSWSGKLDFIYLDAWDYLPGQEFDSARHHYEAFRLIEMWLNPGAIIMIDDVVNLDTLDGKGRQLIPYMLGRGIYEVVHEGYTYILRKN